MKSDYTLYAVQRPRRPDWFRAPATLRAHRFSAGWSFSVPHRPAPWFPGNEFSALDIFISVMSRWRPGRAWFARHCPKLYAIGCAVDARLTPVWKRNFS